MALLYGLAMAQLLVFVVVTFAAARALGAEIRAVHLGSPAILRVRRERPDIRVGPLPSASVDYPQTLARGAQLVITLAPWLVLLGIACACLGPEHGLRSFVRGFVQLIATVDVTPLVRGMLELAEHAPLAVTVGVFAAKACAMNLMPVGGIAGGALLRLFVPPGRALDRYLAVSMLVWMVWLAARFGYALVQVL